MFNRTEQNFQLLLELGGVLGLPRHVISVHLQLFVRRFDTIFLRGERGARISLLTREEQNLNE